MTRLRPRVLLAPLALASAAAACSAFAGSPAAPDIAIAAVAAPGLTAISPVDLEVAQALAAAEAAAQTGQWAQAELWLERALLLQPENAQARLQLAELMHRRGRLEAAVALVDSLIQDPRTPTGQQAALLQVLRQWQTPQPAPATPAAPTGAPSAAAASTPSTVNTPAWRGQYDISVGHSRNPLVRTAATEATLTLPGGSIVLPLQARPEPGTLTAARVSLDAFSTLTLQAEAQSVSNLPTPTLRMGASWALAPQWAVTAQAQRLADTSRRQQLGLQWGHTGSLAPSHPVLLVAHLSAYREPDARRQGPALRLAALTGSAAGTVMAWAEVEHNRLPDGPPGLQSAGLSWNGKVRSNINLQLQVLDQNDQKGYSPLLENNARRHLKTLAAQADWALGASPAEGWVLRVHAARRLSSIPLFAWEDAGFALQWRGRF